MKTDHKPLVYIFSQKKDIPPTIASRLQRWVYFLSGFQYKIKYIKSTENLNYDALSRLPIDDPTPLFDEQFIPLHYVDEGSEMVNSKMIAKETLKNKTLVNVLRYTRDGWPGNTSTLSEEEKKFHAKKNELTIDGNCILWGCRVVVPKSLQSPVLTELHTTHLGMVKMKSIARSFFWWPNLDSEIENLANSCLVCLQGRKSPAKTTLTPWPWPDTPWTRIHSDFLGPFHDRMFMLVLDAHSKWLEIIDMGTCTKATKVIAEFKKLFARFGLPKHVVTDNGTQYTSDEFKTFLRVNGVK